MRELIEKKRSDLDSKIMGDEGLAAEVEGELKALKVRRVNRGHDEVYIDAGSDEASITFDSRKGLASVRVVLYRTVPANGKEITALLKKHGVPY